jgi:hypothetical protein
MRLFDRCLRSSETPSLGFMIRSRTLPSPSSLPPLCTEGGRGKGDGVQDLLVDLEGGGWEPRRWRGRPVAGPHIGGSTIRPYGGVGNLCPLGGKKGRLAPGGTSGSRWILEPAGSDQQLKIGNRGDLMILRLATRGFGPRSVASVLRTDPSTLIVSTWRQLSVSCTDV